VDLDVVVHAEQRFIDVVFFELRVVIDHLNPLLRDLLLFNIVLKVVLFLGKVVFFQVVQDVRAIV
jgi:hypothetical protein